MNDETKHFVSADGTYLGVFIGCEPEDASAIAVPARPSPDHVWGGAAWEAKAVQPGPTEAELLTAWRATARVSRFQARAALLSAGLLDQVETAVATGDRITQLAWSDAQEFRRLSPTISILSTAMGLTDEQLDALFRDAATIEA